MSPKKYYMKAETGIYAADTQPEPKEIEWREIPKDRLEYLEECKRQYLEVERTLNKLGVPSKVRRTALNTSARVAFVCNKLREESEKLAACMKLRDRRAMPMFSDTDISLSDEAEPETYDYKRNYEVDDSETIPYGPEEDK